VNLPGERLMACVYDGEAVRLSYGASMENT
jgi:hypothetical protein